MIEQIIYQDRCFFLHHLTDTKKAMNKFGFLHLTDNRIYFTQSKSLWHWWRKRQGTITFIWDIADITKIETEKQQGIYAYVYIHTNEGKTIDTLSISYPHVWINHINTLRPELAQNKL